MKSKDYRIRVDRRTGEFFLTLEKRNQPMKRLANITEEILLCLCADINADGEGIGTIREIKFDDGSVVRLTVEDLGIPDPVPVPQLEKAA
jgi:hypothetical protein